MLTRVSASPPSPAAAPAKRGLAATSPPTELGGEVGAAGPPLPQALLGERSPPTAVLGSRAAGEGDIRARMSNPTQHCCLKWSGPVTMRALVALCLLCQPAPLPS